MAGFFKDTFKYNPDKIIGENGHTRLQQAIVKKDKDKVLKLLQKGANINYAGRLIHPPLHLAIYHGSADIARLLIEKGADFNLPDGNGDTPLHHAALEGSESLLRQMLELGANPAARNAEGRTLLHRITFARPELVDILVAAGVRVNAADDKGNTPLHVFVTRPEVAARLLKNGADANMPNKNGVTPYHLALMPVNLETNPDALLTLLSRSKPDPAITLGEGEPLLNLAARAGGAHLFDAVIDAADLLATDRRGNSVLHVLAGTQNRSMTEAVLKKAPGLSRQENLYRRTPVHDLMDADVSTEKKMQRYNDMMKMMLRAGGDPDTRDGDGHTLLHHAVRQNNPDLLGFLLRSGAKTDLRAANGYAPLHYALGKERMKCLDLLLDAGADPDLTDSRGWTVLDRLAEKKDRNSPVVQRLIVAGGQYAKQLPLNPEMIRPRAQKAPPAKIPRIG